MRKKELRTRNDQLRRELSQANQLSASQVKQINEHRMAIAILKLERASVSTANGVIDVRGTSETPQRCPTCGHLAASPTTGEPAMKACPDCAEEVRTAARKCRFCGFRFDGVDRPWAENGSSDTVPNGAAPVARLGSVSST